MIGLQDADGVALAAIQGLNANLAAKLAEQARESLNSSVRLNCSSRVRRRCRR